MKIERWIVMRMYDATQWQVENYTREQTHTEKRFDSVKSAATFLAGGASVSIEGPQKLGLGEYAIVRIERKNES